MLAIRDVNATSGFRQRRQSSAGQAVVRFYALMTNRSNPLNGSVVVGAKDVSTGEFQNTHYGYLVPSAHTLLTGPYATASTVGTTTVDPALGGAGSGSSPEDDTQITLITGILGMIVLLMILGMIAYQRSALKRQLASKQMVAETPFRLNRPGVEATERIEWLTVENALRAGADSRPPSAWDEMMMADHEAEVSWSTNPVAVPGDVQSSEAASESAYVDYTRAHGRHGAPPTPFTERNSPAGAPAATTDADTHTEYEDGYFSLLADDADEAVTGAVAASPLDRQKASLQSMLDHCERKLAATPASTPASAVLALTKESIAEQLQWLSQAAADDQSVRRAEVPSARAVEPDTEVYMSTLPAFDHFYPRGHTIAPNT